MIRISAAVLLLAGLLGGCGNPILGKLATSAVGISPSAPQVQPAAGAPAIWLTLPNKGVKFAMGLLESRDGVNIYASPDGTQVFLRDGMIIATRGFGPDLMSSEAPAMATVLSQTPHRRVMFQLDGTDTMQSEVFNCRVQPTAPKPGAGAQTEGASTVVMLDEICENPLRTIRNQYTLGRVGTVVKSRQWVTKGVGYAIVEAKDG